MSAALEPALSVILVTPDRYARLRLTIKHLLQQTARARLEIVIVAPSLVHLQADESELGTFASFQFVEVGILQNTGDPRAAGAHAARAAIIVFGEDHCWPEPAWAAALLEAHEKPWAGVGPTLKNANPASVTSWASFLLNFGPVAECRKSEARGYIPTHNSSYKASLLKAYGERLGVMLETEGLMQAEMLASGRELLLHSGARTSHVNISTLPRFVWEQYWGTRLFWACRAEQERWSLLRRCGWASAAPALFPLRLQRALRHALRIGFPPWRLPMLLTVLCAGVTSISVGAIFGILCGRGRAATPVRVNMEFHRCRYLCPQDKHLLPDD